MSVNRRKNESVLDRSLSVGNHIPTFYSKSFNSLNLIINNYFCKGESVNSIIRVVKRYWKRWIVDFSLLLLIVGLYNLIDCEISDEMFSMDGVVIGLLFSLGFFVFFKIDKLIWKDSIFEGFINYLRSKNGK